MRTYRSLFVLGLLFCTIGCDQGTKRLAELSLEDRAPVELFHGTFRLLYAENTGGFGSLGAHWPDWARTVVLVALPLAFLVAMLAYALFSKRISRLQLAAAALVVGGGIGNLADRVAHGYVVDFMYAGIGKLGTNVFNVADIALMVGIGLLFVAGRRKKEPAPTA